MVTSVPVDPKPIPASAGPKVERRGARGANAAPQAPPQASTVAWLLAVVALSCALRLWIFNGLHGHDDWMYLFHIRNFLNGSTQDLLSSLWGLRWGVCLPIAILFKLFGVHYWLAFAPGFIMGLASIPLAYGIAFRISRETRVARWATLALGINPIDWFVSTTIRGDIEMSCYGGLVFLGLVLIETTPPSKSVRRVLLAGATGIAWGLGALNKEWAYVYAWGFLTVILWLCLRERRIPWVYAWVFLGFLAVLAADGFFLYLTTGVFQQRLQQSIGWFERARLTGGYANDLSLSYGYLPSLFLNLSNNLSANQRFANGYPIFGWYFYLFLGALGWGIWQHLWGRRSAWSSLLFFVIGTLLWIEFGSMSTSIYIPYHKEPRYLTILSVPIACLIGWLLDFMWQRLRPRGRALLAGALLALAGSIGFVLHSEHLIYSDGRDFLPELTLWLKAHPETRMWATGSIQQDLDLRFGYRFADPAHQDRGMPRYGAIQEVIFLDQAKPGDLILITPMCINILESRYTPEKWERVAEFAGPRSKATLFRMSQ